MAARRWPKKRLLSLSLLLLLLLLLQARCGSLHAPSVL
jgi:hypothetical protein